MRIILHQGRRKCTQDMRNELKLLTLCSRRRFLRFICIFRLVNNMDCPIQLKDTSKFRFNVHQRNLRDKTLLDLPTVKSAMGQSTFKYAAAKDCNSLLSELRDITLLSRFKRCVYTYLAAIDNASHICSI